MRNVPGLDPKEQEKVDFYTRQFISAVAPSNFLLTNPAVLRKAKETGGRNLLDGLERLLADLERGRGRMPISMVDEAAFRREQAQARDYAQLRLKAGVSLAFGAAAMIASMPLMGGPHGAHSGGSNVGLGDGSVRFVRGTVSDTTWAQANDPQDGQALAGDW